jgi:DNA modification methylase
VPPQEDELVERLMGPTGVMVGPRAALVHADCVEWLQTLPERCLHAVVTDPPYGLEYEATDLGKLRAGRGGVWRIPPMLDGVKRSPVPRFTVLSPQDLDRLQAMLLAVARELVRVLVPGGQVLIASQPLLATRVFTGMAEAGLEPRGTLVRTVQTLRGGDRPKGAHLEFPEVTVLPRSGYEPWGLFRVPLEGTVAENLRRWGTGGLRRPSEDQPFRDVIPCSPTRAVERRLAPHPSLKPQRFLRQVVRAVLPLGKGIVLDPFAGSGSTVAAACAVGYAALGVERDPAYFTMAQAAVPRLRELEP